LKKEFIVIEKNEVKVWKHDFDTLKDARTEGNKEILNLFLVEATEVVGAGGIVWLTGVHDEKPDEFINVTGLNDWFKKFISKM